MSANIYFVGVLFSCVIQLILSDTVFDEIGCGYRQSDSWLAKSPWLASIRATDIANGVFYTRCAGALLNQKYVLTTASCLLPENGIKLQTVQLDVTYFQNVTNQSIRAFSLNVRKTFYGIENITIHPRYNSNTGQNNIALLRLSRLVKYSRFLQPICLPFHESAQSNTFYTATWDKVLFQSLPIEKTNVISSIVSSSQSEVQTVEWANNTLTLCNGFIGAPLMFVKNNQFYLEGLLNQNVQCGNETVGTYHKISQHLNWIKNSVYSKSQCVTPDNQNSTCISINACPILLKVFANPKKEYEEYLNKFICSNDNIGGFQVCCPLTLNISLFFDKTSLNGLSEKKYCGYQHRDDYFSSDERIALDEFPWLATIRAVDERNLEYSICSGSLINNKYVLTSAFCFISIRYITVVRLGEFNVLNKTDCAKVPDLNEQDCTQYIDFNIDQVIIHPFYNYWTYSNDIALIRLKEKVVFSDYIRPICLPTPQFKSPKLNDILYTTSFTTPKLWGTDTIKKKMFYTFVENKICEHKQTVNEYNMCLQPLAKSIDRFFSCYDDDGAPAMAAAKGQWTLEGIVTERVTFCDASQPIILTKVSSYLHWILENVVLK